MSVSLSQGEQAAVAFARSDFAADTLVDFADRVATAAFEIAGNRDKSVQNMLQQAFPPIATDINFSPDHQSIVLTVSVNREHASLKGPDSVANNAAIDRFMDKYRATLQAAFGHLGIAFEVDPETHAIRMDSKSLATQLVGALETRWNIEKPWVQRTVRGAAGGTKVEME